MTFEEFFTKKRIDLVLLQHAKPDLYEEFRGHYAQMSEKSFDHTKKYWFNRLRKDFLLEIVAVPIVPVEKAAVTKTAEVPAPTTTAAKPAGFKPRFKPNVVKPAADPSGVPQEDAVKPEETPQTGSTTSTKPTGLSSMSPSGFKPRFKPGKTTNKKDDAT